MALVHDFVEDWIEIRSKLQRQLKVLEAGETGMEVNLIGSRTGSTKVRIKKWIDELNGLLKDYANADQT